MKNIKYESDQPLARLEPGDKAIIRVTHFPFAREKDKEKYRNVPDGDHEARCVAPYTLACAKYPELNGRYNMWLGDKRGCSEGIYAREKIGCNDMQETTALI